MNRRQKKAARLASIAVPVTQSKPAGMRISEVAVAEMGRRKPSKLNDAQMLAMYKPYEPIKGVLPAGRTGASIAMDASFDSGNAYNLGLLENINGAFSQGYAFPGFTVLANWAQVPEFRRPAEVYAREMTRKWIKIQASGDDDKSDKIKKIEAEFKRLNVQAKFREAIELDGFFGRGQIFLDMSDTEDEDFSQDDEELKKPLVESSLKVAKNSLKRLTVVEPIWTYPNRYNSDNPLNPTFYKPTSWFVMGKEVHSSRLLTVITRDVPDILKPAYAFAGLSLSQMVKPYVDNWLRTRQSVSDIIHAFTVWVLKTDMSTILNNGGAQAFFSRLQIFNDARDNHGVNAINKESEEFENVSAPLGSLDKLQAQSQEQMCAPTGLPLVYLTGITPAGLNASSQDEIEVCQDTMAANQQLLTPHLSKIFNIVQLSLFGEIDPEIGFVWEELKVVTKKEVAEIRKIEAETDAIHVELGALDQAEVRQRVANEEDSPYAGIDMNKEIEPPDQEAGGELDLKNLVNEHGDS